MRKRFISAFLCLSMPVAMFAMESPEQDIANAGLSTWLGWMSRAGGAGRSAYALRCRNKARGVFFKAFSKGNTDGMRSALDEGTRAGINWLDDAIAGRWDKEVVATLLRLGIDSNEMLSGGDLPLYRAAQLNNIGAMEALNERGADSGGALNQYLSDDGGVMEDLTGGCNPGVKLLREWAGHEV